MVNFIFALFLTLPVLFLAGLTWLSFQSPSDWMLAMPAHFVQQYAAVTFIVLIVALLQKKSILKTLQVTLLIAVLAVNLSRLLPYYVPANQAASDKRIKIMSANVFGKINTSVDPTVAAIRREAPDVIGFTEYTESWQAKLQKSGVLKAYPYKAEGKSHIAVYSKFPIKSTRYFYNKEQLANDVTLEVTLDVHGKRVTLWNSHPPVPFFKYFDRQKSHYQQWVKKIPAVETPFILIGDFNATPWSPNYQNLVRKTGLQNARHGFGVQPSWPTYPSPAIVSKTGLKQEWLEPFISFAAIPIDHVLVSKEFVVLSHQVGPAIGSDHFPVFTELGLRE